LARDADESDGDGDGDADDAGDGDADDAGDGGAGEPDDAGAGGRSSAGTTDDAVTRAPDKSASEKRGALSENGEVAGGGIDERGGPV